MLNKKEQEMLFFCLTVILENDKLFIVEKIKK